MMKACVNIVVFLFFIFLAAPTIVSLLQDEDTDVSTVYSITEEEIQKEIKEVKAGPQFIFELVALVPVIEKSALIQSKYLLKHSNVSGDIFLPPPEVV
ncbi:hypothetical protein [Flavobacterium zepuense]|nr:hypothetical protein [Flavobacterium zepuense]